MKTSLLATVEEEQSFSLWKHGGKRTMGTKLETNVNLELTNAHWREGSSGSSFPVDGDPTTRTGSAITAHLAVEERKKSYRDNERNILREAVAPTREDANFFFYQNSSGKSDLFVEILDLKKKYIYIYIIFQWFIVQNVIINNWKCKTRMWKVDRL